MSAKTSSDAVNRNSKRSNAKRKELQRNCESSKSVKAGLNRSVKIYPSSFQQSKKRANWVRS